MLLLVNWVSEQHSSEQEAGTGLSLVCAVLAITLTDLVWWPGSRLLRRPICSPGGRGGGMSAELARGRQWPCPLGRQFSMSLHNEHPG